MMMDSGGRKLVGATVVLLVLGTAARSAAAIEPLTPEKVVERAIHVCNACHGDGGDSKMSVNPKLAGQPAIYLADQLRAFRAQKRADSTAQAYMWGISALLDENTIEGLAEYYEMQQPTPGKPGKPALMERGRRIFDEGIPASNVRACAKCHGEEGEGESVFPRIAGQHAEYIVKQLQEFRTKLRPHGVIMANRVVKPMTPEDMDAVAAYLQAKP
jgi:cytochrome c553